MQPGDIVARANGTTIEVNNTDAEGRLVLADCLATRVAQGAERLVDLATLTGAIVVALGLDLRRADVATTTSWAAAVADAGAAQPARSSGGCRCTRSTTS